MTPFIQRFKNARKVVQQIRAGEWVPRYNSLSDKCITAHRGDLKLWIGNGPFFCDIEDKAFGLFWRHYVWWAAARKMTVNADKAYKKANVMVL
jgi:hypothetical protein